MRSPIRLPLLQIQPQVWGAKYTLTSDQLTVNVVFFIATLKFNNSRKWLEELWKMLYLLLQFLFCFILIFRRLKGCQLKSAKGKGEKSSLGCPNMEFVIVFSLWDHGEHYLLQTKMGNNTYRVLPKREGHLSLWYPEYLIGLVHLLLEWLTVSLWSLLEVQSRCFMILIQVFQI